MRGKATESESLSTSLLNLVREQDDNAWQRLVKIFGPTVYRWARSMNLQDSDAAEVVQNVFSVVLSRIAEFQRETEGQSFRVWLWTITKYQIKEHLAKLGRQPVGMGGSTANVRFHDLEDLPPDLGSVDGKREANGILSRCFELIRNKYEEFVWTAFWRTTIEGDRPADVAKDLNVLWQPTVNGLDFLCKMMASPVGNILEFN